MAWSYDATNLGTNTEPQRINSVRLLVGDTNTNDQQVQNEEIVFALSQNGNGIYYAAAWIARSIASLYARKVDTQLDGALQASYSDLQEHYLKLADQLEYQGKTSGGSVGVIAGGISKATVEAVRENTDRIKPSFTRDRFRNPPSYNQDEYYYDYD